MFDVTGYYKFPYSGGGIEYEITAVRNTFSFDYTVFVKTKAPIPATGKHAGIARKCSEWEFPNKESFFYLVDIMIGEIETLIASVPPAPSRSTLITPAPVETKIELKLEEEEEKTMARTKTLSTEELATRIAAATTVAEEINAYFVENEVEFRSLSVGKPAFSLSHCYGGDSDEYWRKKTITQFEKIRFVGKVRVSSKGEVLLEFDLPASWNRVSRGKRFVRAEIPWTNIRDLDSSFADWLTDHLGADINDMLAGALSSVDVSHVIEARVMLEEEKNKAILEDIPYYGMFG